MKHTILLITLLMLIATSTLAQIPQTMSYQGVLTDAAGSPVADGAVDLTFKLYDAATDGTMLWEETQQVDVANGLFNVILGTSNPLNLPFDKPYWLGVTIGTDAELQPRTALTSSPYSLNSQTAGKTGDGHSLDAVDGDPTDVVFVSADGKVGIGTREPEGVLEINLTRSNNAAAGVATVGSSTVQFIDPILRVGLNGEPLFEVSAERKVLLAEDMSLGIGTTEPTEVLHVVGNIKASGKVFASAYSSNSPFIMEAPAGTERARIDDITGNFGIGTPAPSEKLDVAGTAQMTGFKLPTGAMSGYVLTSDVSGVGTWQPGSGGADNDWTLSGNDMYSAVSGNVGIGTMSPDVPLHIATGTDVKGTGGGRFLLGSATGNGLRMDANEIQAYLSGTSAGATLFLQNEGDGNVDIGDGTLYVNSDGNVGIGTTTPDARLDVIGIAQSGGGGGPPGLGVRNNFGIGLFATSISDLAAWLIGAENDGTKASLKISSGSQTMLLDGNEIDALTSGLFLNHNSDQKVIIATGGGNVGIGTSSPSAKLDVQAPSGTAVAMFAKASSNGIALSGFSDDGIAVLGTSNSSFAASFHGPDNNGGTAVLKITTITSSGTQRMLLDGNEIDATGGSLFLNNNSSGDVVLVRGGGNVVVNTTLVHSSDRRLKKNITTLDGALDKVLNLRGVSFEWKKDGTRYKNLQLGVQIGFVAQEVETVVPELVKTDSEGYKSVAYAHVTALLIEAVKRQQKTIVEQNAQLQELRSRVNKLERLFSQTAMLNK